MSTSNYSTLAAALQQVPDPPGALGRGAVSTTNGFTCWW